eukprot:TRINITY_DN9754_c0_g1_i2.p1 TRINITY_DN9754_c0_g1~~TRINITY_DN9754_c0_g1_i2.p1  ORF type:complete len:558 (-),score=141.42 TRINITY_DN9754_c0_g1_i2:44-1717(-)
MTDSADGVSKGITSLTAEKARGIPAAMLETKSLKDQAGELLPSLLMEASAIETRLRQHAVELMEPTIKRASLYESKLKEVKVALERCTENVNDLKREIAASDSTKAVVEQFRSELAIAEYNRKEHEQMLNGKACTQENDVSALRKQIEMQASATASCQRSIQSMGDLLTETKEEQAMLRQYCMEKVDANRDKLMKLRDEFENKSHAAENKQFKLQDDVTNMSTVFAHLESEMQRIGADTAECIQGIADLWRSKATVTAMEEQHLTFVEHQRNVNAMVSQLRQQLAGIVGDVKGHFLTAVDVVNVSTAKQIQDMREKYLLEIGRVDGVLKDNAGFGQKQEEFQRATQARLDGFEAELSRSIESVTSKVDATVKSAGVGNNQLLVEVQQLRKGLRDAETQLNATVQAHAVERDVLQSLLESNAMNIYMGLQDDQDRRNIALFGYKPQSADKQDPKAQTLPNIDSGSWTARSSPRTRRSDRVEKGYGGGIQGVMPTVTVDKRCLSCSGSQATVLAGFKLACLQYTPGPVEYQRVTYSRPELLDLQLKLVEQAKERLKSAT